HQPHRVGGRGAQPLGRGGGAVTDVQWTPGPSTQEHSVLAEPSPPAPNGNNGHRPPPARVRRPRRPRELNTTDIVTMVGSLLSSICLCWLAFHVLSEGVGWLGYGLCVFLVYLGLLWIVTADRLGATTATDRVATS